MLVKAWSGIHKFHIHGNIAELVREKNVYDHRFTSNLHGLMMMIEHPLKYLCLKSHILMGNK